MMYYLDILGTTIFAVTGSLAAGRKHLDVFGVVVLSLATALGGGTLRDVALGSLPVFWVADPLYIIAAGVASLATFAVARVHRLPEGLLRVADALGLAVFTVIGAERALAAGAPYLVAVLMGMVTGVAGGMIRDLLSGEVPLILRREIYATASLCGAAVVVDPRGKLLGIYTHGDFARGFQKDPEIGKRPLRSVMTKNPVTISVDSLAAKALHVFETHRIEDLIVLDAARRPVGLVDSQDLARFRLY